MHNPLKVGQNLINGGVVLENKFRGHTDGEIEGTHGIVLCLLPHNDLHPFAVWRFVREESGLVNCMHGDYCETLTEAISVFHARKA